MGGREKTVVTFGTFDLFHIGHLNLLRRAAEYGTRLVVGVSTDELTESKKNVRPAFPLEDRLEIVQAIDVVDNVFVEESLEQKGEYLLTHDADILVMGNDWKGEFDDFATSCNVEVCYLPRTDGISSTAIRRALKTLEPHEHPEDPENPETDARTVDPDA